MKTFAAFALLTSVAYAQLPDIPICAISCFLGPLTSDGCESLLDFACHCGKPELIPSIEPCVVKNCKADEVKKIIGNVEQVCGDLGVPLTVSVDASVTSGATASVTSIDLSKFLESATQSGAFSLPTTDATVTSSAASKSAALSSARSVLSSAASSVTGAAGTSISAAVTGSASSPGVVTQSTGAAPTNAAEFVGMAAAVAALVLAV